MAKSTEIVYLITDGQYYKIGKSTVSGLKSRLKSIQTGNPNKIKKVFTISVYDSFLSETSLKKEFKVYRRQGEWFDFSAPGLLDTVIESMRKQETISHTEDPVFLSTDGLSVQARWNEAFDRLVEISIERGFKTGWVFVRLQELKPTKQVWERYAAWLGYKLSWASIQFDKQSEVLDPPTTMRLLAGFTREKVRRERSPRAKGVHRQLMMKEIKDDLYIDVDSLEW
jgi:hypothetical protein